MDHPDGCPGLSDHGGRVFGIHHGRPVLLLTTVDRDTGAPCTMPVVFVREADRFLVARTGEAGGGR